MMKVLWVTNIPLPEASHLMNEEPIPFGGWLVNSSKELSKQRDIELSIAFPKLLSGSVCTYWGKQVKYYSFPSVKLKDRNKLENNYYLKQILNDVKPDLVHIFGTEYAHSLAMVNACKELGIETVINIQGLVSIISKHYTTGLPINIQRRFTIRDFIKQKNIQQQQQEFAEMGILETKAIQNVNNIIGRTTWDRACTNQINPDANYYYCNETLRDEFYNQTWDIKNCERYSIFLSQGSYPIKGLHIMLEAMPLILNRFPNAKLYIGGNDITCANTIRQKLKISSYAKYIKELIKYYELEDKVIFTGTLDEKRMCERHL